MKNENTRGSEFVLMHLHRSPSNTRPPNLWPEKETQLYLKIKHSGREMFQLRLRLVFPTVLTFGVVNFTTPSKIGPMGKPNVLYLQSFS